MLPAILTQRFLVIKAFSILSLCLILDTRRVSSASSTARLCNNSERRELQHILQLVTKSNKDETNANFPPYQNINHTTDRSMGNIEERTINRALINYLNNNNNNNNNALLTDFPLRWLLTSQELQNILSLYIEKCTVESPVSEHPRDRA